MFFAYVSLQRKERKDVNNCHSLCVNCLCVLVGLRQAGFHNYGDSETAVISTVYPVPTHPGHVTAVYSALPSHYRQPPPSYDQVMQDSQKK